MSDTLRSTFPVIPARLLSKDFDRPAVVESRATCDQCQMCDHGNVPEGVTATFFKPHLKCCTFHPSLPNYLVGAILKDEKPDAQEGKSRIKKAIASRIAVTPLQLGPSKKWRVLYD